jgi:hypothetical protein
VTLEELLVREAIRDTLAIASQAGDHLDIEAYVGCFASDGILEYGDVLHKQGHAELRAWLQRAKAAEAKRGLLRHNVTSTRIEVQGTDAATARSYYLVYTDIGPDHFGWYNDSFVPHEGRWLFKRRLVGVDWVSPQSWLARR